MNFLIVFMVNIFTHISSQAKLFCGLHNLPPKYDDKIDYSGYYSIEAFPWMGSLIYPYEGNRLTTAVVLVSRQIALASASELNEMPKKQFRSLAKVVVGHNCSVPGIPIREYIYHPEFRTTTMYTLALIQLELDHVGQDLMPICGPPSYFSGSPIYGIKLFTGNDCFNPVVNVYKMDYVSNEECHAFYNKSDLELENNILWPKHHVCGKARSGGQCAWWAGTALAIRQHQQWRLVGFGFYGVGCEGPSKFLNYIMYRNWTLDNIKSPGRTTMTRMARNQVILRRSLSHLRRFGKCDDEEMEYEIYSDKTTVDTDIGHAGTATYNLTLVDTVEYTCVKLRAYHYYDMHGTPLLRVRRWCASTTSFCYDQHHVEIKFHVTISFQSATTYEVTAYGRPIETMDPKEAMKYINSFAPGATMHRYSDFHRLFANDKHYDTWVQGWRNGSYKGFKIRRYEVYEHCETITDKRDRRFCGLYEFTVIPDRWLKPTVRALRPPQLSTIVYLKKHFIFLYKDQRKLLQYPVDGYETIINPERQDAVNEEIERFAYRKRRDKNSAYVYQLPDLIYFIYDMDYTLNDE